MTNTAPTFVVGGAFEYFVNRPLLEGHDVLVQPDGSIVVAGEGGGAFVVLRFNANATALDTTFDGDGTRTIDVGAGTADVARAIALQSDAKLVVAGSTASS